MSLRTLFLLAAAGTAAAFYGSTPTTTEVLRAEHSFSVARKERAAAVASGASFKLTPPVIEIFFHLIVNDTSGAQLAGYLTDDQITRQLEVINDDFAVSGTSLSFVLGGIDRTVDATWFRNSSSSWHDTMKNATRVGDATTLNVWTLDLDLIGLGGYATWPWDYASAPDLDGLVIHFQTFPGGTLTRNNLGRILSHEAGHWAGLVRPKIRNDVESLGLLDSITPSKADAALQAIASSTLLQRRPARGCPEERDTCTEDAGLDPIHNHMDYTDDSCCTEFTPGQVERLQAQMSTYRGINF